MNRDVTRDLQAGPTDQRVGILRHDWTDVNGLRMHFLVSVDPVPADASIVVLVHGSGLSGRYMVPTAERLAPDYRVYLPDLPGFGDSDKPRRVLKVPDLADAKGPAAENVTKVVS